MLMECSATSPSRCERGDRIAQLVVAPVVRARAGKRSRASDATGHPRGAGGFGHEGPACARGEGSPVSERARDPSTDRGSEAPDRRSSEPLHSAPSDAGADPGREGARANLTLRLLSARLS